MSVIQNRQGKLGAPGLLALVGVGLVVGYILHLAGFYGWMTLAVAGASLLAAGALWRNLSRFSIPAIVVAIEGAILCTLALPGQLNNGETLAAVANLAIIAALIAAAALIQRQVR
jgi:hypothetical protein